MLISLALNAAIALKVAPVAKSLKILGNNRGVPSLHFVITVDICIHWIRLEKPSIALIQETGFS